MSKYVKFTVIVLFFLYISVNARGPAVFPEKAPKMELGKRTSNKPLPKGYREYKFEMSRLKILELVKNDYKLKSYDADFIEGFEKENWTVLVTVGPPHFKNVFFLFYKSKLYGIMLAFNRNIYSYNEVMNSLKKKYGHPNLLGLDMTIWQDKTVRIQLESSIHLKYLDIKKFKEIQKLFDTKILKKKIQKNKTLDNL